MEYIIRKIFLIFVVGSTTFVALFLIKKNLKVHEGRNIKRFREMPGMKQETLAHELGEEWTQKKISQLKSREKIQRIEPFNT